MIPMIIPTKPFKRLYSKLQVYIKKITFINQKIYIIFILNGKKYKIKKT